MAKGKSNKKSDAMPVIENRKARHQYSIGETLEVGIVLHGSEVKAIRDGLVSLGEGFVRAEADRHGAPVLQLYGVNIGAFGPAGSMGHKPVRARKLLAHKREIAKLAKGADAKGTTIVPLKMYFKGGLVKLLIGVGVGKGRSDKREDLKKRDAQRDIDRAMSRRG